MGYMSAHLGNMIDGSKWSVYDIPNPWVATRPGVAVLQWARQGGGVDAQIVSAGAITSRQAYRDNWGGCINSFVPEGHEVRFVLNEASLNYWKFIEF